MIPRLKRFSDAVIHVKEETPSGEKIIRGIFPITRYENILCAPRVTPALNKRNSMDFQLYSQEEVEIEESELYAIIGEKW